MNLNLKRNIILVLRFLFVSYCTIFFFKTNISKFITSCGFLYVSNLILILTIVSDIVNSVNSVAG